MPIDIHKLTRFPIPQGRQVLTPESIGLYALSIGIAHDPLDSRQLPFVDPLKGPVVMPAMVLVMAHPGFWLADPASGVDPAAVLHAAQGLEIIAPIPNTGMVTSQTRLTDILDKGTGKPALIFSETTLHDANGKHFATLTRTIFIRNGGGFCGATGAPQKRPDPPQTPPDHTVDLATSPNQALLYRLNGDLNPLHSDPDTARRAGFERPILHGLCTMGVVTHALLASLANYDPARLRSLSLTFSSPVYPGETIRTEIWADGRFRARVAERNALVIDAGQARIQGARR